MKLCVDSIASGGLVYCKDPGTINTSVEGEMKITRAIHNILKSQRFDCIPLRDNNGNVKRVARRRLHDGDLDQEIFILDIEECATVKSGTSILEAIFAVLSNEHHILFVMDKYNRPTDVLTMSMLKETIVRDYLNLKVANLVSTRWHWNNEDIDFTPTIGFGHKIHSEIIQLANLVDDDNAALSTDKAVSSQIVTILSMLQPLKDINDEMKPEKFDVMKRKREVESLNVETMMSHPIACLTEDEEDILILAYKLFAMENNWDNILLKSNDATDYQVITGVKGTRISKQPIEYIKPGKEPDAIIKKLQENGCKPLRSMKDRDPYPGIMTIHDLALNEEYLMNLIVDISDIEDRCRSFLLERGELYIPMKNGPQLFVPLANWSNVIDIMGNHRKKGLLTSNGVDNLKRLRKFRNTVIHEYLPLLKDNEKDFPKWYHQEFLSGVKNLKSCRSSLQKIDPNSQLFHAMVGLNKLLETNQLNNFKYSSSGLMGCSIEGVGSNQLLQIKCKAKDADKWQSEIDSLGEDAIFSWTNCIKVDIVIV